MDEQMTDTEERSKEAAMYADLKTVNYSRSVGTVVEHYVELLAESNSPWNIERLREQLGNDSGNSSHDYHRAAAFCRVLEYLFQERAASRALEENRKREYKGDGLPF